MANQKRTRVVVTGYGVVSPLGSTVEDFSRRMFAGDSGIVGIRGKLAHPNFPVPYAGLVDEATLPQARIFADGSAESARALKYWKYAAVATEQALAGLAPGAPIDSVIYGTAEGASFDILHAALRSFDRETFDWSTVASETSLEIIARVLARRDHGQLPAHRLIAINSACASGNQAVGLAFERIRNGEWTRALAGGVDARCEASNLMNFHMLGALTTADVEPATASRPFAKDRTGFVRGEGAATLLLEALESAEARGAKIFGEVVGYGNTSDAYRLTDGRDDCAAVIHAMKTAIAEAGIPAEKIDYVSAHGTSTQLNDRLESKAIREVFGERARKVPVSSLKSQIGHSTVAAGAIESVACLLMLERQKLAPTINYRVPDPECDLDYVPNESRDAKVDYILSNNFGFGGQNACLVFKRA